MTYALQCYSDLKYTFYLCTRGMSRRREWLSLQWTGGRHYSKSWITRDENESTSCQTVDKLR